MARPSFSIITPSFRSSRWLKLCIASVADQEEEHEHIVQDSRSDDGTQDWLPKDPRVKAFIEKDAGMYDAVNRGLRRASGEIMAYINCDEQYLPGTLGRVKEFFERHPEVEVAFGDMVVVNAKGEYLCGREACRPLKYHTWVGNTLSVFTCATFFRRSVIEKHGLFFNAKLRDLGDVDWVLHLIRRKIRMGLVRAFTSVFTVTGANMNWMPNAIREKREMVESAPGWVRRARPVFILQNRLRRLMAGHYWPKPFTYSLYTEESPAARVTREVLKPTFKWPQ